MDWIALLTTWWMCWIGASAGEHVLHLLGGAMGACLYMVVTANRVIMPAYDKKRRRVELGFVGYIIGGLVCGLVINHSMPTAVVGGAAIPPVLRLFFNKILPVAGRVALRRIADGIDDIADKLEQKAGSGLNDTSEGKGRGEG